MNKLATSKITRVNCGKGYIDRNPKFMQERQKIMDVINSVYLKHCAEKIETPTFEMKELFSNKKFPSNRILELDDQGGTILSMRYDLKTPLVRYLAKSKMESHKRYTQSGYIYRKDPIEFDRNRFREFFVSDFDICGPCDPMLTEVECLRVAYDIIHDLGLQEKSALTIGHRKLTECLYKLAANIPESQSVKFVSKFADDSKNSKINFITLQNDKKISAEVIDKFKILIEQFNGSLDDIIDKIEASTELAALKETKNLAGDLRKLQTYCKAFLPEDFCKHIQFNSSLIGCQSYFNSLVFTVNIGENLTLLSGGRYEGLINRFNSAYKDKLGITGFSVGVDQLVMHLMKASNDLSELLTPFISTETAFEMGDLTIGLANNRIKQKFNHVSVDLLNTAKGCIDRDPESMMVREKVFQTIIDCFRCHNADCIDTPVIERKDVLTGKYGEDSKLIYDLEDVDDEKLSLRYDLTVPFARYLAMHPDCVSGNKLFSRYQIGRVYRRDNPSISSGRYREFYQCDFDIAGNYTEVMQPDSECLSIVYETLSSLDLGEFTIKVNHRTMLDGLFSVCGVPDHLFKSICSSVDKLDKTPWSVVRQEMLDKGIAESSADRIGKYVQLNGGLELIDHLEKDKELMANSQVVLALNQLRILLNMLTDKLDHIKFDLSLARGLDYYTGMIFEAVISSPLGEQAGSGTEERVGSVAGGGRYDNLVNMFCEDPSAPPIPCVGLSLGVERLMATYHRKLQTDKSSPENQNEFKNQVMVISASEKSNPLDCPEAERMKILAMLLNNGIASMHSMKRNPKTLTMFQECEDSKLKLQVVLGRDELNENSVQLRSTADRNAQLVPIDHLISRLKQELNLQ